MNLDDITAAWDDAPRAAIHPTGTDPDAYLASGEDQARALAALIGATLDPIIDFGAGDGRVTIPLALLGYTVVAVDSSAATLTRLETTAAERGAAERIRTVTADGTKLGLLPRAAAAIALAVFIHHPHDHTELIIENLLGVVPRLIFDVTIGDATYDPATYIDVAVWTRTELEELADYLGATIRLPDEAAAGFADTLIILERPA